VDIPHAMHASLQTAKGALIRAVRDECGGVLIKFPSATSNSDKVLLKGPEDDIELAKRLLLDLANDTVNSRAYLHIFRICLYILLEQLHLSVLVTICQLHYFCECSNSRYYLVAVHST